MNDGMMVLGVDVGTTSLKMGIYCEGHGGLKLIREFKKVYSLNSYNNGLFCDIEPEKWVQAFTEGCGRMGELLERVDAIAFSGTTPGLVAIDNEGRAIYPAILMLDQRSRKQAIYIIKNVGEEKLLEKTGNLPVPGGCSLASILWIKENHPDIYEKTTVFGHSNTYMAGWLTGKFAVDPSSASLTALYNTAVNDLSWNEDIARSVDISLRKLPEIIPSYESVGRVRNSIASKLGFKKRPHVVIGGNDAVLAAFSAGINSPGDIININGTCEITMVCLPGCFASSNYNVRTHVISGRWLTMRVMNAGGKAYEWFHSLFCSEMALEDFFGQFMKDAINSLMEKESTVRYIPYLMGSRYSLDPLMAEFRGLNLQTTRQEMLGALVKSLCEYQGEHLKEISKKVFLKDKIVLAGGAVNDAIISAKKKWMRDCEYTYKDHSSLEGAAMLARIYLENH